MRGGGGGGGKEAGEGNNENNHSRGSIISPIDGAAAGVRMRFVHQRIPIRRFPTLSERYCLAETISAPAGENHLHKTGIDSSRAREHVAALTARPAAYRYRSRRIAKRVRSVPLSDRLIVLSRVAVFVQGLRDSSSRRWLASLSTDSLMGR